MPLMGVATFASKLVIPSWNSFATGLHLELKPDLGASKSSKTFVWAVRRALRLALGSDLG